LLNHPCQPALVDGAKELRLDYRTALLNIREYTPNEAGHNL